MSEQLIETDEQRELRKAATIEAGKDAHGEKSYAIELIDPSGNLQQVALGTKLKPGWRYATQADRDHKAALEAARKSAPSSSEPPAA